MKDKDFWWAVLLEAEMASEEYNNKGMGKESIFAYQVAIRARRVLRDEFGLNLDDVCSFALEEYRKMFAEEEARVQNEAKQWEDAKRVFSQAKDYLNDSTIGRRFKKHN